MSDVQKIALFIDADNISAKYCAPIMENLRQRGEILIRRIYGNWEKNSLHQWNECILKYGLLAVQQMDFASGINATDMSLTIDAMDVLYSNQANVFAIISSDNDFTPLALRLRERGVYVVGMGKEPFGASFRNACNEFIDLDTVLKDDESPAEEKNLGTFDVPSAPKIRTIKKPTQTRTSRISAKISKPMISRSRVEKVSEVKTEKISKTAPTRNKKISLNERFINCGKNGMRNPKKKLQQIHDALRESAKAHADANGFAPLNFAGQDLKKKNLGFGIKDFGYNLLHEFIGDFPKLYELVRTKASGKSFRYRCL